MLDANFETHFETEQRLSMAPDHAEAAGVMNSHNVKLVLLLATSLLAACGTQSASSVSSPSPIATPTVTPSSSPTPQPAPSSPGVTLYTLVSQPGSTVVGTVQVTIASGHVTLTARVAGLRSGRSYIVDADPLPCEFFVDGPSQSFTKAFKAGADGTAKVVWNVPNGMDANVNVQALTSRGTFAVLACADLG